MVNATFILVDKFDVVLGLVSGGASVSVENIDAIQVNRIPSPFESAMYKWNRISEDYELNPEYEEMTAKDMLYKANVGWVTREEFVGGQE